MKPYLLFLDRVHCIGCGDCPKVCGKYFTMHKNGKVKMKKMKIEDIQMLQINKSDIACGLRASKVCPAFVIHVFDAKTHKRIK